jgi:hypothetical protein
MKVKEYYFLFEWCKSCIKILRNISRGGKKKRNHRSFLEPFCMRLYLQKHIHLKKRSLLYKFPWNQSYISLGCLIICNCLISKNFVDCSSLHIKTPQANEFNAQYAKLKKK